MPLNASSKRRESVTRMRKQGVKESNDGRKEVDEEGLR